MKALMMALLLAVASSSQQSGRLFVHVSPGMQVIIDGVVAGVSTAAEGGKLIKDVPAGPHRVVIRTQDGREAAVKVTVIDGQTTDVNISPLGFIRKLNRPSEDDSSVLRVTAIPADSMVEFHGVTRENRDGSEITFEAIPPGKYPLTVTQGGKSVRGTIDVPKSSIVTADVNFKSGSVRAIGTKPRPRRMQIAEANDALTRLNVPAHWKSAVRSSLPSTVSVLDAYALDTGVAVMLKVPSDDMAEALLESLVRSSSFSRVDYSSRPRREQTGWVVAFNFYFATGR